MEAKGSRISSSNAWTFDTNNLMGHLPYMGQCRGPSRDTRYVRCIRHYSNMYSSRILASTDHGSTLILRLFELLFLGRHHAREFRSSQIPMDRKVYTRGGTHIPHRFRHISTDNSGVQFDGIALLDCLHSLWLWRRLRNRMHTGTPKHQQRYMDVRRFSRRFLCAISNHRHDRSVLLRSSTTKRRHRPVRHLRVDGHQRIGRLFGCTLLDLFASIPVLWNEQRDFQKEILLYGLDGQHNIRVVRIVDCDSLLVLFGRRRFVLLHR